MLIKKKKFQINVTFFDLLSKILAKMYWSRQYLSIDVKQLFHAVDQTIGIDKTNTFQLKFLFYHQNCRSHSFGRLCA